ncbi:MADS-box protein CMB1 [Vitis vinifera]|uniref:MADS-box protein CMB1 n=1 Tax=Vitis vinifera TaxID=29760 RepID=A0A438I3E9_VITVI|nr:MADS-box protein CMB1 [Vitis vinifera]
MAKTLEKYQKCSYGALEASQPVYELTQCFHLDLLLSFGSWSFFFGICCTSMRAYYDFASVAISNGDYVLKQSSYQEYLKLKTRVEVLQRSQRHLLGEDLDPLNTKELEQLEHQLEMSLKQIRSTKVGKIPNLTNQPDAELGFEHLGLIAGMFAVFGDILTVVYGFQTQNMLDQLADLQISWKNLMENIPFNSHGKRQETVLSTVAFLLNQRVFPASGTQFHIGNGRYNAAGSNEITLAAPSQNDNGFGPGWMLWI